MTELKQNVLYFEVTTNKAYSEKIYKNEEWLVEGLIATNDKDSVGDVIKIEALEKACEILKTKYQTVLFNHNTDRPIGKVIDAKVIDLEPEIENQIRKGLWVKILISKTEPEIWQKIQEGVLSKFSFAAYVTKEPMYITNDKGEQIVSHYIISDMDIFECSLVSVPANPNATTLDYYVSKFLNTDLLELKRINNFTDTIENKEKVLYKEKDKKIKIVINTSDIDFTPWSKVDKIKLRNILYEAKNKSAIKEMYGVVRSYEKMTDWGYPHHNLISKGNNTYEMVLNYNGLLAAYKAMMGARGGGKNLTPEERKKLKNHLKKHFKFLVSIEEYDEIPESLKSIISYIVEYLDTEEKSKDKNLIKEMEEKIIKLIKEVDKMEEKLIIDNDEKDILEIQENLEKQINNVDIEDDDEEEIIEDEDLSLEKAKIDEDECEEDDEECEEEDDEEEKKKPRKRCKDIEIPMNDFHKLLKDTMVEALNDFFNKKDFSDEKKVVDKKDKKINDVNIMEVIKALQTKVEQLEERLNNILSKPEVKGLDTQRKEDDFDLEDFINSEKFSSLHPIQQLQVLKILMEPSLTNESKIKEIKKILNKKEG